MAEPDAQPKLATSSEWNGLIPGAEVKVSGIRGTFRFVSYVRNTESGSEWVNVYGGTSTVRGGPKHKARSFLPARIIPIKPK